MTPSRPTAPTNLSVDVVDGGQVDLGWSPSIDLGTGISGYRIYRGEAGDPPTTLLASTVGTDVSYQDLTAEGNKLYNYQVVAFDGAGNVSGPSNISSVATPPGLATHTYTFEPTGDATVDETDPTANYGSDADLAVSDTPTRDSLLQFNLDTPQCTNVSSAELQLTNDGDGSDAGGDIYTTGSGWDESALNWNNAPGRGVLLNSLADVGADDTSTVDVTNGVTAQNGEVDFRVGSTSSDSATYHSRESANSNVRPQLTVVCTSVAPDTLAPSAPANLSGTAPSNSEIDLTWSSSTDNLAVEAYRIYRNGDLIGSVPSSATSFQDTTVSPSSTYGYRVTAIDGANNESSVSNLVNVTSPK